jgi:hypothetical protein
MKNNTIFEKETQKSNNNDNQEQTNVFTINDIDNDSNFSSPAYTYTEWSDSSIEVNTLLSAGTWYIRVRAIDQGLKGTYATLTFTR